MRKAPRCSFKKEKSFVPLDRRKDIHDLKTLLRHSRFRKVLFPHIRYNEKKESEEKRSDDRHVRSTEECGHYISAYTYIFLNPVLSKMLYEVVDELKEITNSTIALTYLYDNALQQLVLAPCTQKSVRCGVTQHIRKHLNLSSYVGMEKRYILIEDILKEFRIPQGFKSGNYSASGPLIKSVLGVPILTPNEELIGVVEFCRTFRQEMYTETEANAVVSIIGYIGCAFDQHHKLLLYKKHNQAHDFLSDMVKSYYMELISAKKLLPEILSFGKNLIEAERVSFMLIDNSYEQLVGDLFEEVDWQNSKCQFETTPTKVKLDPERSLMAWAAVNKEAITISDTKLDNRVTKKVDIQHGVIRRSIICMPIMLNSSLFGTVQLINKKCLLFNELDERLLRLICHYCSITSPFSDFRSEEKLVADMLVNIEDMTKFHIKICPHDYEKIIANPPSRTPVDEQQDFNWSPKHFKKRALPCVISMLTELIEECRQNLSVWTTWVIRVRKFYRDDVPYHNFFLAFDACHSMYNILIRNKEMFSQIEISALMISCLCHHIDHRGLSNNFYQISNHSFSRIYPHPPLEHHHYYLTIYILRSVNLFPNMTQEDRSMLESEIYECILATNMTKHITYRRELQKLLDENQFSWSSESNKKLVKCLMMTCALASAKCKMGKNARTVTEALFHEFYSEADLLRKLGYTPLPYAHRDMEEWIADFQLDFLKTICSPGVEALVGVLPNLEPLKGQLNSMMDYWDEEIKNRGVSTWHPGSVRKSFATRKRKFLIFAYFITRLERFLKNRDVQVQHSPVYKPSVKSGHLTATYKINDKNKNLWYTKIS